MDDDYANNFGGFGDEGGLGNIDFSKLGGLDGADAAGLGDSLGSASATAAGHESAEAEEVGQLFVFDPV